MKRLLITMLTATLLTACTDPFVVIPGGKLEGEVAEIPADWGVLPEVVQLEVRPAEPYSVNIWALQDNGDLYIATRNAKWTRYIEQDNRIRLRIEGKIYNLVAEAVEFPDEIAAVTEAYIRKYDIDGTESFVEEGQVFRLTPR